MGNRATVIFTDGKTTFSPAAYLHWNGGPESIYGFLEELDRREVRADQEYECARFIQIVGEFMDNGGEGGLSLGVANGPKSAEVSELRKVRTDHGDNGFYLVNRTTTPTTVARFIERWGDGDSVKLTPLTEEQVATEKAAADKSDYRPSFREFFAKLADSKKKKDEEG